MHRRTFKMARPGRRIVFAAIPTILLIVLLAFDLANQGFAWRIFWSLTGEERPLAQIRGMVEWLGNFTRPQPRTEPLTPIAHAGVNPFGINTFLEQEVERDKREQQVRIIAEMGFAWIRQEFPWEDIEIAGRGDFEDRRNEATIGIISAWDKYDHIVDLAEQYGLQLQVRLSNPPDWTHANPDIGTFAPPDDLQDYLNFAVTVAERYRGRVHHYQIWNEPNIYPEWGEQAVNPDAYTELLCRTYAALKAVDPEIVVISGALAPTVSLTGRDLNDFIFLQRIYDAGAGECFDVLSVQGYGFNSGPTDRRMRPMTLNFARNVYIRDLMVANGDADKAIWISEAAWNPVDDPNVPPDIANRDNYGHVTPEQAARYMPLAYDRAQQEWPWIGVINYWYFKRAAPDAIGQSWYYFRMMEPDFTPQPIYHSMRDYIANLTPTLYPGVHQAEHWAVVLPDDAEITDLESASLGSATEITDEASFVVYGTEVILRWAGHPPTVLIDGENPVWRPGSIVREGSHQLREHQWYRSIIHSSLLPETHTVRISRSSGYLSTTVNMSMTNYQSTPFILDSITVLDRTAENLFPILASLAIAVGMTLFVLLRAIRERAS